jgi:hypothetical protein
LFGWKKEERKLRIPIDKFRLINWLVKNTFKFKY